MHGAAEQRLRAPVRRCAGAPKEDRKVSARSTACVFLGLSALALVSVGVPAAEPPQRFPLTSPDGLLLHNVSAQASTLDGHKGLQIVMLDEIQARIRSMDSAERQRAAESGRIPEQLAIVDGLEFGDGIIEAEITGEPLTGLFEGARGFVGIAFRVQKDRRTYDAFYLRPTNARADDQIRRNRSVQYISHPDWTWFRFRQETPGKYESYVDLVPGKWTRIKIEVRGTQARLFVGGATQPSLIVNDLKTGAAARGAVALWLDLGTIAHFRNLSVSHADPDAIP
jgi:hypothetical protein